MILLSLLLFATQALAVCVQLSDCPQYAHLNTSQCQAFHHFLARGSDSPYPGHVIETVGKICNALNSNSQPNACGYEDVQYPAQNLAQWCASAHEGAINGAKQMSDYASRCPNSHLIVFGYSQGASVFLDVLGGGGGDIWSCTQQSNPPMDISSPPGSKIAAALVVGSARRSAGQSWTQGGGQAYNGTSPRSAAELAGLQPYADAGILREYCQPGDPICASGSPNQNSNNHLNYFDIYGDEMAAWVIDLAKKAAPGQTSSASKSSTTQPSVIDPSVIQPSIIQPSIIQPSIIQSSIIQPSIIQPSIIQPSIIHSSTITPTPTKPSAPKLSISKPSTPKSSISKPSKVRASIFVSSTSLPNLSNPSINSSSTSTSSINHSNTSNSSIGTTYKMTASRPIPYAFFGLLLVLSLC